MSDDPPIDPALVLHIQNADNAVREELRETETRLGEAVDKSAQRIWKQIAAIGAVVAALATLGVYGLATGYIDESVRAHLEKKGFKEVEERTNRIAKAVSDSQLQAEVSLKAIRLLELEAKDKGLFIPYGSILPFSGSEKDLNAMAGFGWVICDGTNGTPDLRNRFILGAETPGKIGEKGGQTAHAHSARAGGPSGGRTTSGMGGSKSANSGHTHTITLNEASHFPPFYKVIYLMRVRKTGS